ncbi:hypothetical protein ACH4U7_21505 [Streptomyces sp. NPDC020845]|uniref:hypothetical protein n=1 Tax=Streptomyces sp. NPDC020845 TaxID=3365096 RepID=UPI0037B265C3
MTSRRGSAWAKAASARVRSISSAATIRASARCSSQATASAASACTVIIAGPA